MSQESTRIFENSVQEYDAWFDRHLPVYESEIRAIKEYIPPSGKGLEIGLGTGRFAAPLGIQVGVEPAGAMARIARKRGIKVYKAYAEELPFEDKSFDFILMVTVLCFLSDPFRALSEATRVLKPAGRLIIGMIDPDSPLGRSYEATKEKSKFYRQARFHPVSQVLKWLEDLGYQNPQTCQTTFDKPLTLKKKDNRAIPVKMVLKDLFGNIITDANIPGAPPVVQVTFGNEPPPFLGYNDELVPPGLSDDGNAFRYDQADQKWILNLATKQFTASGTYTVTVKAGDASYVIDPACSQTFTRLP